MFSKLKRETQHDIHDTETWNPRPEQRWNPFPPPSCLQPSLLLHRLLLNTTPSARRLERLTACCMNALIAAIVGAVRQDACCVEDPSGVADEDECEKSEVTVGVYEQGS